MACSKPQRVSYVDWNEKSSGEISTDRIMEVCRVEFDKAISVEIIQHLCGGPNMEYNSVMEVENSIECYKFCKADLLGKITKNKLELAFFEERQKDTSTVMIAIVKQPRTSSKREHLILNVVIRLTINVTPRVGFVRYLTATGKNHIF